MRSDLLVSCIMPTRGRASFAAAAVACFDAQTWPNRELVIVDDSDCPSFPDREWPENIQYFRPLKRHTVGAKRNLAIAHARGEIIAHFDDDDWSAPGRLAEQVARLESAQITGYRSMVFVNPATREAWKYNGSLGYALGTSLCYRVEFWKCRPFPDVMVGEDNAVVKNARGMISEDAGQMMYASVHASNTSKRKMTNAAQWQRVTWPEWIGIGKG